MIYYTFTDCDFTNKMQHKTAYALLEYAFGREGKIYCADDIYKDEKGKPHIKSGNPEISVSHCMGMNAVMISEKKCGVDCEYTFRQQYNPSKRIFSVSELEALKKLERFPDEKAKFFFRIWTLKEAYSKTTGNGLNSQLSELTFSPMNNIYYQNGFYTVSYLIERFMISAAAENETDLNNPIEVDFSELKY